MTEQKRAQKGGEYGINGFWYNGGQYLPNTQLNPMGKSETVKGKKQEVAPYKWEVAPSANHHSIYRIISLICVNDNGKLTLNPRLNPEGMGWKNEDLSGFNTLVEMYNSGERWVVKA